MRRHHCGKGHHWNDLARLDARIAIEAVERIFTIEREINGLTPQERLPVRDKRIVALEI